MWVLINMKKSVLGLIDEPVDELSVGEMTIGELTQRHLVCLLCLVAAEGKERFIKTHKLIFLSKDGRN